MWGCVPLTPNKAYSNRMQRNKEKYTLISLKRREGEEGEKTEEAQLQSKQWHLLGLES